LDSATIGHVCRLPHWPPGWAAGVTGAEAADAGPAPTALVAVTVNVYAVPLVSPLTVAEVDEPLAVVVACAVLPMYGVTVYEVIGLPPSPGAAQVTVALASPAVALTPVGAPGAVGVPPPPPLPLFRTSTAISHVVLAPVPAVADTAEPAVTTLSSASISMSLAGERLTRCAYPVPAVTVLLNPESAYSPSASPSDVVAAVVPELTAPALDVVPVACACWSRTVVSVTVDSPAYSRTTTPRSAEAVAVAVTVGLVPPVFTTAVHTLISVWSEAV
jgi:hypothetical protein